MGLSTALCWHTHLTVSLTFGSFSLSSLTPAQWILLGPPALISPSLSHARSLSLYLASVLLRGCSDRESGEDLSKGCCCQVNGKSFTCLFEALLKCAWSFITNWPYGLLSFMAGLQRDNHPIPYPLTFCKWNKESSQLCIFSIFLSWKQFNLAFNHFIVVGGGEESLLSDIRGKI